MGVQLTEKRKEPSLVDQARMAALSKICRGANEVIGGNMALGTRSQYFNLRWG